MKRFSDSLKADILRRTDIVALVRESVELRKAGASFTGLCPFHAEKTPSFHVNPARQIYHCFGCGVGGDAFSFLMARDGLTFPEALRLLAERAGVQVEEIALTPAAQQEAQRNRDLRDWVLQANELACTLWEQTLWGPAGERARDYLLGRRGLTEQTVRHHRLGYALPAWDALTLHLRAHLPERLLPDTGLVRLRDRGGCYDWFRDRVVMPVFDIRGRVIAFSGRILEADGDTAKYINSPETPLFRKGESLFGLRDARAAIRQAGHAVLVEGNFDMLTLHQAGVTQAVAPLGTALTIEQVRLLRRFTERVLVCYDGDAAGRAASLKTAPLMAEAEVDARRVELPAGEDPDSFVRTQGVQQFQRLLDAAPPLLEALVRATAPTGRASVEQRLQAWEKLVPVLARLRHPLARQRYVALAAELLDLDEQQLHRYIAPLAQAETRAMPLGPARGGERWEEVDQGARHLLELLIDFPDLVPQAAEAGIQDAISEQPIQDALKVLFALSQAEGAPSASRILEAITDPVPRAVIQAALARESRYNAEVAPRALEDILRTLRRRELARPKGASAAMLDAERRGDDDAVRAQLLERLQRARERKGL